MATAGDIITAAFQKIGIDSPTAAQTASALISLNNMISLWGADFMQPVVTRESFTVAAADSEYTIGSGGQWDTVRPMKIITCYLRDSDNNDYPVTVKAARDYAAMSNKSFTERPTELYFIPESPLAKVIFNTSPDQSYTASFEWLKNFTEFAATTTDLSTPNEYKEALVYNLAVSIAEDWDRTVSKTLYAKAEQTKAIIDRYNATLRPIPRARFDLSGMAGIPEGDYSIVSDGTVDGGAF